MAQITQLLAAAQGGDAEAKRQLLPLVYDELRQIAAGQMQREKPGHTLQPTALVHEAYLRLIGKLTPEKNSIFASRGAFFAAAATAMRHLLIDAARRKQRAKRGGQRDREPLPEVAAPAPDERLLALDEALTRLATEDPLAAQIVELRFFADLSHEDVAAVLETTVYQVRQKWTYARAWLQDALKNP